MFFGLAHGLGLSGSGGAAAPAPTVAITSHVAGAIIERLDGAATFTAAVTDATAAELFADVGNTGSFVSWGAMAIAAGVASVAKLPATTDCNEAVVLKVTATGAGGTTTSATVTVKIRKSMADIGTLVAWRRMDRGVTVNGADVEAIADQSGNGYHRTASAGHRPAYEAAGWNGAQPSARFDPAGTEYMLGGGAAAVFNGSDKPFTWVCALEIITGVASQYIWMLGNNVASGKGSVRVYTTDVSGTIRVGRYDDALASALATDGAIGTTRHVLALVFNGTAAWLYVDGTVSGINGTAMDVGTATFVWDCLGALAGNAGPTVSNYADMRVAEEAIFSNALNATAVGNAGTLLKLRLSGLP